MKTVLAVVAGFVLVIMVVHADAQRMTYFDGNDLKGRLADTMGGGYILGVVDTTSSVSICSPERAPHTQLVAIVQKYLADHPEKLHIRASDLVISALSAAFPCRK